jgi:hypothetical protein
MAGRVAALAGASTTARSGTSRIQIPAMIKPDPASIERCIVRQCGVSAIKRSWSAAEPASTGWMMAGNASRIIPMSRATASARTKAFTRFLA